MPFPRSVAQVFPSKPLRAYGDGGACFTDNDELATKMAQIRLHGQDRRYNHPIIGINGRMDTLQAAILLSKFEIFPEEVELRALVGAKYTRLLKNRIVIPYIEPHNMSVFAQYTIQVDDRERFQLWMKEEGIPTAVHYPVPLNLQPAFAGLNKLAGSYPVSEATARKVMSLPMHPYMSDAEIELICQQVMVNLCAV